MKVQLKPIDIIPDEKSKTDDWISFYNALEERYGKNAAVYAFIRRWTLRRGSGVDITEIEKRTGLKLDKTFIENIERGAEDAVDTFTGFFKTIGTGGKIVFYSSIGLCVLLVGGIVVRLITLSAEDAGKAAGTAAKLYSGRV